MLLDTHIRYDVRFLETVFQSSNTDFLFYFMAWCDVCVHAFLGGFGRASEGSGEHISGACWESSRDRQLGLRLADIRLRGDGSVSAAMLYYYALKH